MSHPFFTSVLYNTNVYLIDPPQPFLISKDTPKDEKENENSQGYKELRMEYEKLLRLYCMNKLDPAKDYSERVTKVERFVQLKKDALCKEYFELKRKERDNQKLIEKMESKETNIQSSEGKIKELEEENSILKGKCEKYENELINNDTDYNKIRVYMYNTRILL